MERQLPKAITICVHSRCSRSFSEPTELTTRVKDSLQTYPACPYCFAPVGAKRTEDPWASTPATEIQVEQVTLEFLREMELVSDTEGRCLSQLASKYVPA